MTDPGHIDVDARIDENLEILGRVVLASDVSREDKVREVAHRLARIRWHLEVRGLVGSLNVLGDALAAPGESEQP